MLLMTENIFHLFQSGYCSSVPLTAVESCLVLWNGIQWAMKQGKFGGTLQTGKSFQQQYKS